MTIERIVSVDAEVSRPQLPARHCPRRSLLATQCCKGQLESCRIHRARWRLPKPRYGDCTQTSLERLTRPPRARPGEYAQDYHLIVAWRSYAAAIGPSESN